MRKKDIYLLLFIPLLAFSDLNIERVNSILSAIKSNNKSISYFTADKSFFTKLNVPKSKSMKNADVLLFPKDKNSKKVVIVDSYSTLKKNENSIGAIYIKKGRTQIMFVEERLKAKGLELSSEYKKYIIKECYLKELCFLN
jgi:predicted GTPase